MRLNPTPMAIRITTMLTALLLNQNAKAKAMANAAEECPDGKLLYS